jgi:hypothetical protein
LLPLLALKIHIKICRIIISALTVRVHTGITGEVWARLWYLCRAFDAAGTGYVELDLEAIQSFLCCSAATVYRLLQEGKQNKAFRRYRVKDGTLQIYLGGLFKVCDSLGLKSWGAVAEVLLVEVLGLSNLRSTATAIQTQKFQQQSRYAANAKLKPEYRREFGAPHPHELLKVYKGSSHKTEAGPLPPYVLHLSESRIWVSKNFVHFGTSQNKVATSFDINKRTVRRHQQIAGMYSRQICQKKATYMWVKTAWDNDSPEYYQNRAMLKSRGAGSDESFKIIGYKEVNGTVRFTDGVALGQKKQSANKWDIPTSEFGQRFFKMGSDYWMNRCNIYEELHELTTMRASARKYRKMLTRQGIQANSQGSTKEPSEKNERGVQGRGYAKISEPSGI